MRIVKRCVFLVALMLVVGCNRLLSVPEVSTSQGDGATFEGNGASALSRSFESDVSSGTSDSLYVANAGNNSITIYRHDASGDTEPLRVISGSKTGLDGPGQLSEDSEGNLYVANSTNILVFAHGAGGDVAPIRKISGSKTDLHDVDALTVDKSSGDAFVVDTPSGTGGASTLIRFAHDANGNVAPLASAFAVSPATEMVSDSSNKNLIESYSPQCCEAANQGIATYAKSFRAGEFPDRLFNITAFIPASGVADDATTHTYLASGETGDPGPDAEPGLYRFAEDTSGNFPIYGVPRMLDHPIVSIVTSETCGTQLAVAPGPTPNTYVAHSKSNGCKEDAVYVYAHDASGNAAPLRTLEGSATHLDRPSGIYEGA
jgi:hypothetical protein